ncbi:MAG: CHASE2 domain-containing protein [Myxococcaceae bacterium]
MKNLIFRRRDELLVLAIALAISGVHWWSDDQPVLSAQVKGNDSAFSGTLLGRTLLSGVHTLEGRATDAQFRIRGERTPHPDVLVALVDERGAQKYGLWPWSRSLVAQALINLHQGGVAAIGMDMSFTDKVRDRAAEAYLDSLSRFDADVPEKLKPQLATYRQALEVERNKSPDADLAAAFAAVPEAVMGVITYPYTERYALRDREAEQEALLGPHLLRQFPERPGKNHEVDFDQVRSWRQYSAMTPLESFAKAGKRMGYFNIGPDPDGTLRRVPLFAKLEGPRGLLPHFTVQTAALYFKGKVEPAWNPDLGIVGARIRPRFKEPRVIPLDPNEPYALINHQGPASVFNQVSLADVIDGRVPAEQLKGKAVLMGVGPGGNFDQRVTPFSEFEPGVFTNASFLSNILSGEYLTRPLSTRLGEIIFMLVSGLVLAVLLPRVRFLWKALMILVLASGYLVFDQVLFNRGIHVATVLPLTHVLLSSFALIFMGYLSTDREKGMLRSTFQHYLNESVMEEMLRNPDKLKLGGEKKEMTVIFSDIRGFTTLSESMAPEALVKFINDYLSPMTEIVFEEGGTLDKYIGDALMAFWGAPLDQPDHALRACRASVRFLEKLKELKAAWRDQNLPDFDIGVGLNSGPMIVGNMGSAIRFDYTVMGDSVNLASRLEGTNKEYGTRLLMSESTYAMVKDDVSARRLGAVRVKGKNKPVGIYELRGVGKPTGPELEAITTFEQAVDAYVAQDFVIAHTLFTRVLELWPEDGPSARYVAQVAKLRVSPPGPGWDGVYTATTK